MDYNSPFDEQKSQFDSFELQLTSQAESFLGETAKWATFLAIVGFIGLGLTLLGGVFFISAGDTISRAQAMQGGAAAPFPMAAMGIFYIITAVITFFPILYLLKFANTMKSALASKSTDKLTEAFENMKSHYKFLGIITIIFIALFILLFIFGIVAAVSAATGAM
jgi:uncharacterized protein involved in cysteine biosynthesis